MVWQRYGEDSRDSNRIEDVFDYDLIDRGIYRLSSQLAMEQKAAYDANKDWKDHNKPKKATATVGVEVTEAWDQAKKEFSHVSRTKFQERLGTDRPSFESLFDHIFGEESKIFKVFQILALHTTTS